MNNQMENQINEMNNRIDLFIRKNGNESKHNQTCLHCGGYLKKFRKTQDWNYRKYHKKCYTNYIEPLEYLRINNHEFLN